MDGGGKRVRSIEVPVLPAGEQVVPLERKNLPAGVYVVRVSAGDQTHTRRLALLQ